MLRNVNKKAHMHTATCPYAPLQSEALNPSQIPQHNHTLSITEHDYDEKEFLMGRGWKGQSLNCSRSSFNFSVVGTIKFILYLVFLLL